MSPIGRVSRRWTPTAPARSATGLGGHPLDQREAEPDDREQRAGRRPTRGTRQVASATRLRGLEGRGNQAPGRQHGRGPQKGVSMSP